MLLERVSVAPMMDCTDRHYRMLMRCLTQHTLLYTEMVTADAIIHGDREYLLGFNPEEKPLVLQLGGSDSRTLALAATIAEAYGYDGINLNVGCPSSRVQAGRFGACLMKEPDLVADCVSAMQAAVSIPVTVKTRLGVDDEDSYPKLWRFIDVVRQAGCDTFILHARKAWLQGLSPRENREVPPLRYSWVYQIKRDFPNLCIAINGGIKTIAAIQHHLQHVDGVMVGRAAVANPYLFASVDQDFFAVKTASPSRQAVVSQYLDYVSAQLQRGVPLRHLARHLIGLYQGQAGAKRWRRHLSEHAGDSSQGVEIITKALALVA